ncbi:MAG TPA: 6-phosphogluconolactonase, partial [Thermohalobaculum sp.]|nr:6-phosphogluconolactonase [Thermohalobaculum sp.]
MIREHHFDSSREAAEALAGVVADRLRSRLARRERAVLVVSGGTTPIPLFRSLRQEELPWGRIVVTLADERWVPLDHEDRNERLVRTELLVDRAAEARFVGFVTTAATPEEGAELSERNLAPLQPFDVVVLGMGTDGHTASLFPHAPGLEGALDPASRRTCTVVDPPAAP